MSSFETQNKIISIIKYIKSHPADVKFFQLDEGLSFIMDGKLIDQSNIPFEAKKYIARDHFYIQVNPEEKEVMFYAYDVVNYATKEYSNQDEGKLDWWNIAEGIWKFLSFNLTALSSSATPYQDMGEKHEFRSKERIHSNKGYDNSSYHSNNYQTYDSSVYKEKEAFSDKLKTYLQANQSSLAIEYVEGEIARLIDNNRIETLDYIYKWVGIEKMTAPVMVAMLTSSKAVASKLKERKEFFDKVKTYLDKIKPNSSTKLLKNAMEEKPAAN